MGLAASQARLLMLTARKSDLELQMQMINQARMQLSNMLNGMFGRQVNLEPDSQQGKAVTAATSQLQQQDKMYEMQAQRISTQHEAIQTELDAVKKVISKNISSSFNVFNG